MVDVADAAVVAILTRAPARGGKSRLFAELSMTPDPGLLTALLLDTLDGIRVPGVTRVVAVEPPDACDEVRALIPEAVTVVPQHTGTLGDRMRTVMTELFGRGARIVVLVGSDIPDIDPDAVARAVALLNDAPDAIVVGPASDGGYYLIGAAGTVPPVFDSISWGTPDVMPETLRLAEKHRRRVILVNSGFDVDTVMDLRRVRAARTRAWVRDRLEV
jgi:rSAM/selenodomain-associated transferase 1